MTGPVMNFSLKVEGTENLCPTGEDYAKQNIRNRKIPVLACEGPCIRGEIAKLAANLVAQDLPFCARACHGEVFYVPQSFMATWVKRSNKVVMIDGCFLECHGRVLRKLIEADKIFHEDAFALYEKFSDVFLMDQIPEKQRKAVARDVADKVILMIKQQV